MFWPEQNGRYFADNHLKGICLGEDIWISNQNTFKSVPNGLNEKKGGIGVQESIASNKLQTITRTNYDHDLWRHIASLGHNVLTWPFAYNALHSCEWYFLEVIRFLIWKGQLISQYSNEQINGLSRWILPKYIGNITAEPRHWSYITPTEPHNKTFGHGRTW